MRLLENFRNQIEELSNSEKRLVEELQEIPEKVQKFNSNANEIGNILKEAEKALENVAITKNTVSMAEMERSLEVSEKNRLEAAEKMEKLGQELVSLADSLTPQQLQEQEEVLLSKSAKCKALISKIDQKKKEVKNGKKALILQDQITKVKSEMTKIDDEVEDRDEEGNRRCIDSIVHSRRQNEQHFEAIEKYKALQVLVKMYENHLLKLCIPSGCILFSPNFDYLFRFIIFDHF